MFLLSYCIYSWEYDASSWELGFGDIYYWSSKITFFQIKSVSVSRNAELALTYNKNNTLDPYQSIVFHWLI